MKKLTLILALAQAAVFAQTGLLGGKTGLHQQDANTIGFFHFRVGTGGTISGIAHALKPRKPGLRIVAVQPAESPMLTGGAAGTHGIQGIMGGFVPANYDKDFIDEVISVTTADAIATSQELARTEGVNAGISSGAALAAATVLAARPENAGKNIVAILPDTGERYLSTALFPKVDE